GLSPTPVRGRPAWRTWLRRICLLLVLSLLGIAGHYLYARHQIHKRLREAVEAMDREEPGWQLEDLEAARPTVPDPENSAFCVLAANEKLPAGWKGTDGEEELQDLPANVRLGQKLTALLQKDWRAAREARTETLRLIDRETGHFPIPYNR